jgi:phage terminase Nu1 subunit (DNA packaging protein)
MSEVDERLLMPKALTARVIGISVQAFNNWGMQPHSRRGREALYYLPDVVAELVRRRAPGGGGEDGLVLDVERARLAKEQADKVAMENAVRRGELSDLNDISKTWGQALANFRSRMLASPSKLAPQANPDNPNIARDVIAAEHERILTELAACDVFAEPVERTTSVPGTADDHPTTAKADDQPVGGSVPAAKRRKQRRTGPVEH